MDIDDLKHIIWLEAEVRYFKYTFELEEARAIRAEKALALACEDTNTWRNTLKICKLEPEYFLQRAEKEIG